MARKLRLESEGGIYHVINRGNYRGDVFRSDRAKTAFLQCLGEACEKCGWVVHAWCVMSNHYHLALETPRGKLKKHRGDLKREGKSVPWKLALAAAMKARTVATNRWLSEHLHMGNLHEVSRKVTAWSKAPDAALSRKLR